MKRINSIFFAAAAAAFSLVSCSQENLAPVQKPQGELVTVHFGAESGIASTKATLTTDDDEATFKSAWENGDVLSVKYDTDSEESKTGIVDATWQSSSKSFDAELPSYIGTWSYDVIYPTPVSSEVDFGSSRTQKGNEYNGIYDLMRGSAIVENAAAGKDGEGNNIVFIMTRQTAVAYFHLTSELDEEVVSATLSVDGGKISADGMLCDHEDGFVPVDENNKITITYGEGTAPKATDFKLWFNVLPAEYTSMTLEVETTGHKLTLNNSNSGKYEAANLYKVVKEITADKWVEKKVVTGWELVTDASFLKAGDDIVIVSNTNKAMAADMGSNEYLSKVAFTFSEDVSFVDDIPEDALVLTLGGGNGSWTLSNVEGDLLVAEKAKKLGWKSNSSSDFVSTWTISIGINAAATISSTNTGYGKLLYNVSSPRFLNYTSDPSNSMVLPQIYRYVGAKTPRYNVTCAENIEGGSVEADASRAVEGKEITLTYSVETGYEFKGWDVKDSDGAAVEVSTDGKFTMPAKDVTVSAVFSKVEYTIVKTEAVNGSFTVKVNGKEAAVANYGDEVTLEADPTEGYSFDKWTVVDNAKKTVSVSNNKFTMPAANVSVSATFIQSTFASLEDLVAAGKPTSSGRTVTVTLNKEIISKLKNSNNGVYIDVKKSDGNTQTIGVHCSGKPSNWTVDGLVSGTLKDCKWSYVSSSEWRLSPANYNELTYTPAPVINCEDETVEAGATHSTLTYSIDNPMEAATVSVDKFDGKVVTNATIDEATSTVVCTLAPNTTASANTGSVTIKYAHVSKTVSITQEANTLTVDQTSKTWASDAADEFVIKVDVNDGASWNVTPTTLDWATVSVDKTTGTITVKPNGKNESDKANEAMLTVAHATATTLTKTITLKQNAVGAAVLNTVTLDFTAQGYRNNTAVTSLTVSPITASFDKGSNSSNAPKYYTSGTAIRCYGGNTITLTGAAITKVEVSFCTSSDGSNTITTDSGTYKNGVWTGTSSSVKFTIGGTSGNRRIQKLTVTYAE